MAILYKPQRPVSSERNGRLPKTNQPGRCSRQQQLHHLCSHCRADKRQRANVPIFPWCAVKQRVCWSEFSHDCCSRSSLLTVSKDGGPWKHSVSSKTKAFAGNQKLFKLSGTSLANKNWWFLNPFYRPLRRFDFKVCLEDTRSSSDLGKPAPDS